MIIERKGTKILAENQKHIDQVIRNASFFKKIKGVVGDSDDEEDHRAQASTRTEINNDAQASLFKRGTYSRAGFIRIR
jgi:hypothetical protein